MDRRILFGGEGIELAAEVFEAAVDLPRPAAVRPLEEGVLGEVRQSVLRRQFVAAAGIDRQCAMRHAGAYLSVDASDAVG